MLCYASLSRKDVATDVCMYCATEGRICSANIELSDFVGYDCYTSKEKNDLVSDNTGKGLKETDMIIYC